MRALRAVVVAILLGHLAGCQAIDNDPLLSSWDKKPPLSKSPGFSQPVEK
jgi:hypothetical protein